MASDRVRRHAGRWLDVKRQAVEPKTIESYEWVARRYFRPALTYRNVGSLRPTDLDAFDLALDQVDLVHRFDRVALTDRHGWDGSGEIEGVPVVIEVKPVPTIADADRLRRPSRRTGTGSSSRAASPRPWLKNSRAPTSASSTRGDACESGTVPCSSILLSRRPR